MKLGEKIRMVRTLKGYSQEAVAESLGLSVTGYAKIERNETDVTVSRLEQIAKVFEVRLEDILSFDEKVAFHNYSGSRPNGVGQFQNYYNNGEVTETAKALYESRITRLEEESVELRKQLFEVLKGK